jgi:hypothetical protein
MSNKYPVRYVAFIDILGFRNIISRLDKDEFLLDEVCKLLSEVHRPREELNDLFKKSEFRSATISDAVALSAAPTPAGLANMIAATEMLANKLLLLGYFVRGAIVKDRLFHNDEMVLGAGLVRAYSYESSVALYPRIMLTREIVTDIEDFQKVGTWSDLYAKCARRSKDGPHYLHILRFLERVKTLDGKKKEKALSQAVKIRDVIEKRLDEAVDTPAHYQKIHWFADYWNDVFYGVEGLKKIDAPGLEIALIVE